MRAAARVLSLLEGARTVFARGTELGQQTREELEATTGLSPQGVELALSVCLELNPSQAELEQLLAAVPAAPRALVLLSANVFVGAHRALALALASSSEVFVRPSRRDPVLVQALAQACPGLFQVVTELEPRAQDAFWAYGTKETLRELQASLPSGVHFFAHGPGLGAAVVELDAVGESELSRAADGLAKDTVLFDQRGCLSPRMVLAVGSQEQATRFAELLFHRLKALGVEVPRGQLSPEEVAELARFRQTLGYVGELLEGPQELVAVSSCSTPCALGPVGRVLHVQAVNDPILPLARIGHHITALGFAGSATLKAKLAEALPQARLTCLGAMQCPPFDGPVDRRAHAHKSAWRSRER